MDSRMASHWFPTMVVGLGGTGIRTIRFLHLLIANDTTGTLQAMVDKGALTFVGIDTDDKANQPEIIDDRLTPDHEGRLFHGPQSLPVYKGLIQVDTEAIVNAVEQLRGHEHEEPDTNVHASIRTWFPELTRGEENDITLVQAFTGAAQWRVLGRAGFFLQFAEIHGHLLDAFSRVQSAANDRARVIIVSSLSGGTGSGMFWDPAFLLRNQDQRCLIQGMFLLPSAFEGLKNQKRVKSNAFAALKEIATCKNWLQPDTFTVTYPSNSTTYVAKAGGRPAFNAIYLYHAFKTDGSVKNLAKQRVLSSCLGLARNALALMRVDTHLATGEGKDNDPGDAGADAKSSEGAYAFSTTACAPIPVLDTATVTRHFHLCLLDHLRMVKLAGDRWPKTSLRDLRSALLVRDDALRSVEGWIASMISVLADRLPEKPSRIEAVMDALGRGLVEAQNLIDRVKVERPFPANELAREVKRIYTTHTAPELQQGWAEDINRQIDENPRPPVCNLGDACARYAGDLDQTMDVIIKAIGQLRVKMEKDHQPLTIEDTAHLRAIAHTLKAWHSDPLLGRKAIDAHLTNRALLLGTDPDGQEWGDPSDTDAATPRGERPRHPAQEWLATAPSALLLIRITLGLVRQRQTSDQKLVYAHDSLDAVGPAHLALRRFFEDAISDLEPLTRHASRTADADRYFAAREYLLVNAERLAERLEGLVAHSERLMTDLANSVTDITAAIGRAAPEGLDPNWPEQLGNVLAPLPTLLSKLPAPQADPKPYQEHARGITNAIVEVASGTGRIGPKLNDLRSGARQAITDAWETALAELRTALPPVVDKGDASLLDVLFQKVIDIAGFQTRLLGDPKAFEGFLFDLEAFAGGGAAHWCAQDEITLERLGSIDGIARLIRDHMPRIFNDGVRENDIRRSHFLIAPPLFRETAGTSTTLAYDLEAGFHAAASTAKAELPKVIAPSPFPVIYFEDHCRALDEIEGIRDYFNDYQRLSDRQRQLYHLFRGAPSFKNRISPRDERRRVPCGNDGCDTHDIRSQPNSDIFCKGCGKPIRNRCGNDHCPETDLVARIREKRINGLRTNEAGIPYKCPACDGNLRTYWWYCDHHKDHPISTAILQCPTCEDEHFSNRRQHSKVGRLEGGLGIECPGCLTTGAKSTDLRRVPWALKNFFENGVGPHDADEIARLAATKGGSILECDNQRVRRHFLFPAYRLPNNQVVNVFRIPIGSGKASAWRTDPPQQAIHFDTCFHCGHPVVTDPAALLVGDSVTPVDCPRCLRPLRHCAWCSPNDRMLLKGEPTGSGGPLRCPRCTNDMQPMARDIIVQPGNGRKAGFCINLFGCRAGSQPWSAVSDLERINGCAACEGQFTERVRLLPRHRLEGHVKDCPLCLLMIGQAKDGKVHRLLTVEVLYRFMRLPEGTGTKALDVLPQDFECPVCSGHRGRILRWLSQDDGMATGMPNGMPYFAKPYPAADAKADLDELRRKVSGITPPLTVHPSIGIGMLEVLRGNTEDNDAYERLDIQNLITDGGGNVQTIRQSLLSLFADQKVSSGTLNRRFQTINDLHTQNSLLDAAKYTPAEPAF
ncbi:tubulin-like doman-containing protein [Azospirillum soli]|uniref:tubulin-like doman-containing protein n=1 Tax=Azospirillum soli TaxID=1304799 RepID=UPI001AE2A0F2|nr:tubulin-like doman-containing protein [Azospirillum soli]MBP2314314.1 hypothetical protein [Azospirillum soli]